MNILIDTHILLWHIKGDNKLKVAWRQIIQNPENRIFVSMASLWEIAIKTSLGKLDIPVPLDFLVPTAMTVLPIEIAHLKLVQTLPHHHGDPFDRLILAQSLAENLTLMTDDAKFKNHEFNRI